jgi:hypothetical protein
VRGIRGVLDCAPVRHAATPIALLTAALVVAGCGGSGNDNASGPDIAAPSYRAPANSASKTDFPKVKGRTLGALRAGLPGGIVLAPSVSVIDRGKNRYGFALFDTARKQIAGVPVALYVSKYDGSDVHGPYVARAESLKVKPQFAAISTTKDPDAAKAVYVADLPFAKPGRYRVSAIAELDGRMVSGGSFGADVHSKSAGEPPRVGEPAPKIHTPTLASVRGDASRIDTRNPPAEDLLKTDFYDAYGKKPALLLFATPALCASRVCGPVVDVLEQVRSEYGKDDVAFIHNEIYKENRVDQGLRPEPAAFRIPTEPWLFAIDRHGRVVERLEGAFSVAEAERALAKAKAG